MPIKEDLTTGPDAVEKMPAGANRNYPDKGNIILPAAIGYHRHNNRGRAADRQAPAPYSTGQARSIVTEHGAFYIPETFSGNRYRGREGAQNDPQSKGNHYQTFARSVKAFKRNCHNAGRYLHNRN